MRIGQKNLAYPLLKDAFSVLGSSQCKALSVLDLKNAFTPSVSQIIQKDIVQFYHILLALHIYIKECP